MRLPWEKLAMEFIEVSAPELGMKLHPERDDDEAEALAGWGGVHLIKWALAQCPDHQPPSANDVVRGPFAARQIARAAKYKGEPDDYVKHAVSLRYPTLELVPDGIRVRGLDRYDTAWGERNKAEWAAWKLAHPDRGSEKLPRTSPGLPRDLPSPDTDAESDTEEKPPPPRPPKLVVVGKGRKALKVDDLTPHQRALWERIQRGRANVGLLRETSPPAAFPDFCDLPAVDELKPAQLEHAIALYLRDADFKAKLWPTAVLISPNVWNPRVQQAPPDQLLECDACVFGAAGALLGRDELAARLCHACCGRAEEWARGENPNEPWLADFAGWAARQHAVQRELAQ